MLAALLALFTPIADPARLSVSDQISRLNSGQTRADKFDYKFLRFDSGIYGRATLAELAKRNEGPQAAEIAKRAAEAVVFTGRYQTAAVAPPTPEARAANVSVFPASQTLPDSFFQQDWKALYPKVIMPFCLTSNSKCEAFLVDLDGDGTPEILLLSEGGGLSMAFKAGTDGGWMPIGSISNSHCPGVREALRDGKFHAVQPPFSDIEAGGERLRISAVNCGWPR